MNQFNPGASWYSSLFLPNNYAQVLATFPIVLAGGSSNAPFTTIGGNDQTYTQGRKVTQWQINDNLIWTRGRHSFKFGENSRRLDVSDYDLGEGVVPTVVYNDLAQFTYGAASTATAAFPITQKESIAAGNLDLYAMDTYKLSQRWTLIAGLRATWNTNPVNQHGLFARPAGSFLDMSHDAAQPLSQAIQTNVRTLFPAHAALQLAAARVRWPTSSRTRRPPRGRRHLQRHHPGAGRRPRRKQTRRMRRSSSAESTDRLAASALRRASPSSAVDATAQANQSFQAAFRSNAPTPFAVNLNTFPSGTLKTPYFLEWSLGLERELGPRGSLRVDYVGTRAVQEPYQVQLNGYQTVCNGCFAPFAFNQPLDSALRQRQRVPHRRGQPLRGPANRAYQSNSPASPCAPTTPSAIASTRSRTAACFRSPRSASSRRCPAACAQSTATAITTSATTSPRSPSMRSRSAPAMRCCEARWADGRCRERQFCIADCRSACSARPTPRTTMASSRAAARSLPIGSRASRSTARPPSPASPSPAACSGSTPMLSLPWSIPAQALARAEIRLRTASSATPAATTIRGPHFTYSEVYVTKKIPITEHVTFRFDTQFFNVFNHPNFALPTNQAGTPGEPRPRPDSARLPAPSRRPPDCSASGSAATARRA